jgi:hypothetical protein
MFLTCLNQFSLLQKTSSNVYRPETFLTHALDAVSSIIQDHATFMLKN